MPINWNYGPNPGQSGTDPRGRLQNQSIYQQQRQENTQGPLANYSGYLYGRGAETGFNDYNNTMAGYDQLGRQWGLPTPNMSAPPQQTGSAPQYNSQDPASVDAYIAWMQKQPGVNPSVINDPNYWRQKMLAPTNAGGLGPDASYVNQKMMTPEGAPAGSYGFGGGTFNPEAMPYFRGFASGGNDISLDPEARAAMSGALAGYGEFAQTGGYSAQDIANMRARGVSPVRAAYANAERELQRGRSLQGGYSPNMAAAQVKMAREQGQGSADAIQNVEAGLAEKRNQGRQFGISGMGSTGASLGGLVANIGEGNMNRRLQGAQGMAGSEQFGAGLGLDYSKLGQSGQIAALTGKSNLYGTTPGMASTFGNQALTASGQGASFGNSLYGNDITAQQQPGQFEQTTGRINTGMDIVGRGMQAAGPIMDYFANRNKPRQTTPGSTGYNYAPGSSVQLQNPYPTSATRSRQTGTR